MTEVGIGSPVWTADSRGIVFTEVNEQWRSYRARLHWLGDAARKGRHALRGEEDKGFSVGVGKSHDRSLIVIATGDNSSTEVRFVPAGDPLAEPVLVVAPPEGPHLFARRRPRPAVDPRQ